MGGVGDAAKKVYGTILDPAGLGDKPPGLKTPKKPDLLTPEQQAKAAALAADKKKKEAIGAYSASDQILTGPKGLGSTQSGGGKKLLGE